MNEFDKLYKYVFNDKLPLEFHKSGIPLGKRDPWHPEVDYGTVEEPWFSRVAIMFLSRILNETMNVFEYGGGSSTFWFLKKCNKVFTIENHNEWTDKIKETARKYNLEHKLEIRNYPKENQESKLAVMKEFNDRVNETDVVIVDGGYWRADQAKNAIHQMVMSNKKHQILIIDNAQYPEFNEVYSDLYKHFRVYMFTAKRDITLICIRKP